MYCGSNYLTVLFLCHLKQQWCVLYINFNYSQSNLFDDSGGLTVTSIVGCPRFDCRWDNLGENFSKLVLGLLGITHRVNFVTMI